MKEKINNFYELDAWKKAHQLVVDLYKITKQFPNEEIYGLTSQIRRSSSSVPANIAEGFSRYSYKDKARFYYIARGSITETQNHILLAKSINYMNEKDTLKLIGNAEEILIMINGLLRSIRI